jgi:hypothetical protein
MKPIVHTELKKTLQDMINDLKTIPKSDNKTPPKK